MSTFLGVETEFSGINLYKIRTKNDDILGQDHPLNLRVSIARDRIRGVSGVLILAVVSPTATSVDCQPLAVVTNHN